MAADRPVLKTRPGVDRPEHGRRPAVKRSPRPEPEYRVESDIDGSLPVTRREVDAIEMFLGAEIDALLAGSGPKVKP